MPVSVALISLGLSSIDCSICRFLKIRPHISISVLWLDEQLHLLLHGGSCKYYFPYYNYATICICVCYDCICANTCMLWWCSLNIRGWCRSRMRPFIIWSWRISRMVFIIEVRSRGYGSSWRHCGCMMFDRSSGSPRMSVMIMMMVMTRMGLISDFAFPFVFWLY